MPGTRPRTFSSSCYRHEIFPSFCILLEWVGQTAFGFQGYDISAKGQRRGDECGSGLATSSCVRKRSWHFASAPLIAGADMARIPVSHLSASEPRKLTLGLPGTRRIISETHPCLIPPGTLSGMSRCPFLARSPL